MSSLSVPWCAVDDEVLALFRDKGWVIAPDGQGDFSLIRQASQRTAQARAERISVANVEVAINRFFGGVA